jgi:prepilin-type N-terminal cleavage/methylation domain-containing protein
MRSGLTTGFTLIEMTVVVAIVAVVATGGMVSFSALGSLRLETEALKLVTDLSWARQMAVARHRDIVVDFNLAQEVYTIYHDSITAGNEEKHQALTVDIASVTPAPERVTFYFPQGTSESKQIQLSHRGKTRQVTIFASTGHVKFQ